MSNNDEQVAQLAQAILYWKQVADEYEVLVQKQKRQLQMQNQEILAADAVLEKMGNLFLDMHEDFELENNGWTIMRCARCGAAVWANFDEYGFRPEEHDEDCPEF